MLLTVFLAGAVLMFPEVEARPAHSRYVKAVAEYYARLHPNTDSSRNPLYGDLYQGDIMLIDRENYKIKTNSLNAVTNLHQLWPKGVAYYTIEEGVYNDLEVSIIKGALSDFQNMTKVEGKDCIKMKERKRQRDFILIKSQNGCYSNFGKIGGQQELSLGKSLLSTCVNKKIILHELLHSFGFLHEQSRHDRDDWVTINWDNIVERYKSNFVKIAESWNDPLGTPYDYGSIMHYDANAFATDPNVPTIIPKDLTAKIGVAETLSKIDIERVQIQYGCIDPADSIYFRHIDSRESLFK